MLAAIWVWRPRLPAVARRTGGDQIQGEDAKQLIDGLLKMVIKIFDWTKSAIRAFGSTELDGAPKGRQTSVILDLLISIMDELKKFRAHALSFVRVLWATASRLVLLVELPER